MDSRNLVLGVVLVAAGSAFVAGQSPSPQGARIEGRVLDASGQPVGRASIILNDDGVLPVPGSRTTPRYAALSGADGRFELDAVLPGRYRLAVEKSGFLPQAYGAAAGSPEGIVLDLTSTTAVTGVTVTLTPLATITGKVLDEHFEPVRGSNLRLYRRGYDRGEATLVNVTATVSDAFGEFKLIVGPGRYYLASIPPRRLNAPVTMPYVTTFYPGAKEVEFALPLDVAPGATLTGVDLQLVTAPAFQLRGHIDGAISPSLLLLTPRGRYTPQAAVFATPKPDGSFDMDGVVAGRYTLVAATDTMLSEVFGWTDVDVYDADVEGLFVPAEAGFKLQGRLHMTEGDRSQSMPGIRVILVPDGFPNARSIGLTEADGTFVLEQLRRRRTYGLSVLSVPPGSYVSSARLGNLDLLGDSFSLADVPRNGVIDIELKRDPGEIFGTVHSERGETVRAIVTLVPRQRQRYQDYLYKRITTDDHGRFVVHDVAPQQYELFAWDALEPDAEYSSEFLTAFRGTPVTVRENSQQSVTLRIIQREGTRPSR